MMEMTTMTQTTQPLPPNLQAIADKVIALQRMKDESGFQTKKSIRELLSPLSPDELAIVAQDVYQK
jgi:hypothetical protein